MKGKEVQVCISLRHFSWCFPFQEVTSLLPLCSYLFSSFSLSNWRCEGMSSCIRKQHISFHLYTLKIGQVRPFLIFAKDLLKPSNGTNQNARNAAFVTQLITWEGLEHAVHTVHEVDTGDKCAWRGEIMTSQLLSINESISFRMLSEVHSFID